MAEFGSVEHVRSLSREQLEGLFRSVFDSRNDLNTIIKQQSQEIAELRRKVANQAAQLKEVQTALERRNQGALKARWQRTLDALKAENERLSEEVHYLKKGDILHVLTDQEYIDQCERESLMQASIDALDKENAKLRELIRELFRDFANADYELKSRCGRTFMAVTRYLPRLQELEVDA